MYEITKLPSSIDIGFTGEHQFRVVEIDMRKWMRQMPNGVPSIVHIRPHETINDAYIANTTFENGILRWVVTQEDLGGIEGVGTMQVWLEAEANNTLQKRGKSALAATQVYGGINDPNELIPPARTMLLHLAADAVMLPSGSDASVELEIDQYGHYTLHFKIPKGSKGDKGDNGDPAPTSVIAPAVEAWMDANITQDPTVVIDQSLAVSGAAADSKAAGDFIKYVERQAPASRQSSALTVDLDITDEDGNVIARFSDGHIKTKEFDSRDFQKVEIFKNDSAQGADLDITDENGNVIMRFSDGHIKTKEFDSRKVQDTNLIKDDDAYDTDLDIVDSFGNVIVRFSGGHIFTKNFDSSAIASEEITELQEAVEDLQGDVGDLKEATSGIMYRMRDATDGVYAACRWHQPKNTNKQFCMLVAGDIHGDSTRMESMVDYLNNVAAFDAGIMLGDIDGPMPHSMAWYTRAIARSTKPFLTAIGNHDAGDGAVGDDQTVGMYTYISELYDKYIPPNIPYAQLAQGEIEEGNCYYYKDFDSYKIRVIVLNQFEYPPDLVVDGNKKTFVYPRGYVCYAQDQIDWFCDVLNDTPSDYGVIVALHIHIGWMDKDMDNILTCSHANRTAGSPPCCIDTTNGYIIEDIVNAWVNGTSLEKSYDYTVSGTFGTSISVDADFTSRGEGEFITYICGHWHMSIVETSHYHGQASYTVAAAGLAAETQSDTPRVAGLRSEDHFVALAVDREEKTVKVFQVGAHYSKDGVDRQYGQYSYEIE